MRDIGARSSAAQSGAPFRRPWLPSIPLLLQRLPIAVHLPLLIFSLVLVAIGGVGLLSFQRSSEQVVAITGERLQVIAQNRQVLLDDYIVDASRQLEMFADNPATAFTMSSFTSSYMALDGDPRVVLQRAFTNRPTIPADRRDEAEDSDNGSLYAASHKRFHAGLQLTAEAARVADLYLIDRQGDIIYTVRKSTDFGALLTDPALAGGPLSAVHARAMAAADALAFGKPGMPDKPGVSMQDFQLHAPIGEAAMFIARAVKTESGRVIGTAVFRLSNTVLKTIMQDPTGLARSGDAILVGQDGLLRSESRLDTRAPTLLTKARASEAIPRALSGESGTMLGDDHLGRSALLAYRPIELGDHRVALIVSLEAEEAFAPVRRLAQELVITAAGCLIIVAFAGILYARSITRPLSQIVGLMGKLAGGDAGIAVVGAARGDEIGAMARAVEVFKRNTTDVQRLLIEQARQRSDAKVQVFRHRFEQAMDSALQAIALYDADDKLVACNASYVDLHKNLAGESPNRSAIIGLTFEQALHVRIDNGLYGVIEGDKAQFVADRGARFRSLNDYLSLQIADGRWMQIDSRHTPDGTVINIWTDITHIKAAEAQQRTLEAQLQHSQRLEALGTMAGGIAHDLNNTLVPILGLTQLMDEMLPETGGEREILGVIADAAMRAKGLVRQILAFSRKEQGERKVFDFTDLVREALTMVRSAIPATIRIDQDIHDVPPVDGDAGQLHQVLVNLITNASQAIGNGTGVISVTLGMLQDDPTMMHLTVRDTGCGMDEATRARVFEPFFTTKPVNEGTGLGLSVVHGIVSAHGGTISVTSDIGQGCSFELTLPIAQPSIVSDSATQAA